MRILFSSIRLTGHLRPLFPYAAALQNRGHEIRVAAPQSARNIVQKEGFEFVPFGHPGDDLGHEVGVELGRDDAIHRIGQPLRLAMTSA